MARSATNSSRSRETAARQSTGARRTAPLAGTARPRRAAAPAGAAEERKLPRKKPSSGISRVDQEATRTHGYAARVGYERTETGWRPRHKAFFGDRTHGNPTKALKAAEEWVMARREEVEKAAKRGRGARAEKASK